MQQPDLAQNVSKEIPRISYYDIVKAETNEGIQNIKLNPEQLVVSIIGLRQIAGIPNKHQQVCQRWEKPRDENKERVTNEYAICFEQRHYILLCLVA